ncbi:MAG: hypothetical protein KDC54_07265, partial [Lewinella sp.]|nr:hypothetical protein [Lewinella sp.]
MCTMWLCGFQNSVRWMGMCLLLGVLLACESPVPVLETGGDTPLPSEWVDATTGHRLRRLTETGDTRSFYFHNQPFLKSADGESDLMVYYGQVDEVSQLFSLNLQTGAVEQLTDQPGRKHGEILGEQ